MSLLNCTHIFHKLNLCISHFKLPHFETMHQLTVILYMSKLYCSAYPEMPRELLLEVNFRVVAQSLYM